MGDRECTAIVDAARTIQLVVIGVEWDFEVLRCDVSFDLLNCPPELRPLRHIRGQNLCGQLLTLLNCFCGGRHCVCRRCRG